MQTQSKKTPWHDTIKESKNILRAKYKSERRAITKEQKMCRDEDFCRTVISLVSYRFADTMLCYAPLSDEINLYPVIEDAIKKGKNVAFPLCNTQNGTMNFHIIDDLSLLKKGAMGIMEPPKELPIYNVNNSYKERTLCLIPALAFDKRGHRLGYGGGYYDRYLTAYGGVKAGTVYSDFITEKVPTGRFDCAVDFIITEKGVTTIDEI